MLCYVINLIAKSPKVGTESSFLMAISPIFATSNTCVIDLYIISILKKEVSHLLCFRAMELWGNFVVLFLSLILFGVYTSGNMRIYMHVYMGDTQNEKVFSYIKIKHVNASQTFSLHSNNRSLVHLNPSSSPYFLYLTLICWSAVPRKTKEGQISCPRVWGCPRNLTYGSQ